MLRKGKLLGELYLDIFARPNKIDGAAHFTVQCGRRMLDGKYRCPRVVLVFDFSTDKGTYVDICVCVCVCV